MEVKDVQQYINNKIKEYNAVISTTTKSARSTTYQYNKGAVDALQDVMAYLRTGNTSIKGADASKLGKTSQIKIRGIISLLNVGADTYAEFVGKNIPVMIFHKKGVLNIGTVQVGIRERMMYFEGMVTVEIDKIGKIKDFYPHVAMSGEDKSPVIVLNEIVGESKVEVVK